LVVYVWLLHIYTWIARLPVTLVTTRCVTLRGLLHTLRSGCRLLRAGLPDARLLLPCSCALDYCPCGYGYDVTRFTTHHVTRCVPRFAVALAAARSHTTRLPLRFALRCGYTRCPVIATRYAVCRTVGCCRCRLAVVTVTLYAALRSFGLFPHTGSPHWTATLPRLRTLRFPRSSSRTRFGYIRYGLYITVVTFVAVNVPYTPVLRTHILPHHTVTFTFQLVGCCPAPVTRLDTRWLPVTARGYRLYTRAGHALCHTHTLPRLYTLAPRGCPAVTFIQFTIHHVAVTVCCSRVPVTHCVDYSCYVVPGCALPVTMRLRWGGGVRTFPHTFLRYERTCGWLRLFVCSRLFCGYPYVAVAGYVPRCHTLRLRSAYVVPVCWLTYVLRYVIRPRLRFTVGFIHCRLILVCYDLPRYVALRRLRSAPRFLYIWFICCLPLPVVTVVAVQLPIYLDVFHCALDILLP